MEQYTIKDLENLSGIKAHTLRIWEQRYSILKPQRTNTNIRYYSAGQLKKILNVSLLNKNGFKISHIDKMTDDEINHKLLTLSSLELVQKKVINELIQHMVEMDADGFEDTLDRNIATIGIEKTMLNIIYPYLEKIGMLWQTNHINPAQEHIVANIIRQKIILAIAHLPHIAHINKPSTSALLFLPEGEHHEITLLFIQYIFKRSGVKVYYLGSSLPIEDVVYSVKLLKPTYLYTHVTILNPKQNIESFSQQLLKKTDGVPLLISGRVQNVYHKKTSKRIVLFKSFAEVMDFVKQL